MKRGCYRGENERGVSEKEKRSIMTERWRGHWKRKR